MFGPRPLSDLRSILRDAPTKGRVIVVAHPWVQVATTQGMLYLRAGGTLRVGQQVVIVGDTAYPAASPTATYPL